MTEMLFRNETHKARQWRVNQTTQCPKKNKKPTEDVHDFQPTNKWYESRNHLAHTSVKLQLVLRNSTTQRHYLCKASLYHIAHF